MGPCASRLGELGTCASRWSPSKKSLEGIEISCELSHTQPVFWRHLNAWKTNRSMDVLHFERIFPHSPLATSCHAIQSPLTWDSFAQVRMPKASGSSEGRELYPLDTNLLKTPVAGEGSEDAWICTKHEALAEWRPGWPQFSAYETMKGKEMPTSCYVWRCAWCRHWCATSLQLPVLPHCSWDQHLLLSADVKSATNPLPSNGCFLRNTKRFEFAHFLTDFEILEKEHTHNLPLLISPFGLALAKFQFFSAEILNSRRDFLVFARFTWRDPRFCCWTLTPFPSISLDITPFLLTTFDPAFCLRTFTLFVKQRSILLLKIHIVFAETPILGPCETPNHVAPYCTAHTYIYICYMYIYIYICMYTYIHTHACIQYTHICIYAYTYVYTYVYHVHVHVHTHTYIYI